MKIRTFPDKNYKSIFFNGKTIRQKINENDCFYSLEFPEIEDWGINTKCLANCSYCYTSAIKNGTNFSNIIEKLYNLYSNIEENKKPFQVAIGGSGEPTLHPLFNSFLYEVKNLGIMPNYTTNGMHITPDLLQSTITNCGGVAVSYHPHIKKVFINAISEYQKIRKNGLKLNIHIIIGEELSLSNLQLIYENYKDKVDYIVILPYQSVGRAISLETNKIWNETINYINKFSSSIQKKFAFGALFYDWFKQNNIKLDIDIYEPELFSGYRLFNDSYKILRKSSYNLLPKF